jgi:hypothetical protein
MNDNPIAMDMDEIVGEAKTGCQQEVSRFQLFDVIRGVVTLISIAAILAFALYYRAELEFLLRSIPAM